ncbi:hypothetical protein FITA111629_11850 [Filibacter tadaridae]|uniref:DUF4367 domain-containing protein n=1 Tax=Filibacter tadaridae TaxID=2483811 RepID=A0A3P5WC84_9BACL|nr:hypothetical protein [Filibacter tadaridae]VDC21093.1 hypothetical protein FILTAD_00567 [Filibacter tadaridae]
MSNLDKQAKKDIDKRTTQDTHGLKDEIWDGLENELFSVKKGEVKKMKRKKKKRVLPFVLLAAAAIILVFTVQTDTGMAFIKTIKDMFVPEKEVVQNIEGQDEITNVDLHEGQDSNYIIYVDETRYKVIKGEVSDIITTIDPLPEKYPEVTMEIKQVADEKPEDLVKKVEADLIKDFPELRDIKEVTEPVEGFLLHGAAGSQWDSKIVHTYIISNGKKGSFIIKENYFLEAAEGHGARFHRMLESFEIVE